MSNEALKKFWSDFENKTSIEFAQEVMNKLDLLSRLINSLTIDSILLDEKYSYIEPLLVKFIFQISSFLNLFKGSTFYSEGKEIKIFDEPSVHTLSRSIFENYLTFTYLFINKKDNNIRFIVWKYSGIINRLRFYAKAISDESNSEKNVVMDIDKKDLELESEKLRIEISQFYLEKNEKDNILKGDKPRILSWRRIIEESQFDDSIVKNLYSFLSSYSHSEFHAVNQIKSKKYGFDESSKSNNVLLFVHLFVARSIIELTKILPSIQKRYLTESHNLREEIQLLYDFSIDSTLSKHY